METKKLVSMVDFILEIDWLTTKEFCDAYGIPYPYFTGEIKSSVDQFLQVDAIKHKMFVEYAKFLRKDLKIEMFIGENPIFVGFEKVDVRGGNPKVKNRKYEITNDQFGFWLEPYDSVDGYRLHKIQDLVGLNVEIINK